MKSYKNRAHSLLRTGFIMAMALATQGVAQAATLPAWPNKPLRIIAPSAPGTPPDVVARILSERLATALGQAVVVENRPGAGFTIGLQIVAKATPDGYTMGVIAMPAIIAPSLLRSMPYDTAADLVPVSQVLWNANILVVRASSSLKSVQELVVLAKTKPAHLTFASGGIGTPAHMAGELLRLHAGVDIRHVPFKGAPAGVTAVVGEQIDLMFAAIPAIAPHIMSGRLRALATPAPQRITAYPDVPTMAEKGFPGFDFRDWQGIVAPAGTPKKVIARMAKEIARIVAAPEVKERFVAIGMEAASDLGPAQFGTLLRSEQAKWAKVVRDAGIRAD